MRRYNILVTGVGAIIGYGIISSLRKSRYDCFIVGMDIYDDAAGQVWCDVFLQAIPAADENYIAFLKQVIDEYHIDLVFFGTEQEIQKCPNISRVIDEEGNSHISIILGPLEKTRWSAMVVGMIDSASETDTIDITICANSYGVCDTYTHRSILSAIDRCKASVTTHAGALTTIGDVAVWLSGDVLKYSKKMSFIMIRQPLTGFEGDIADYESKIAGAKESWKEFSGYVAERGLFTKSELATMFETRGLLCLYGRELEARVANLKTIED